ncbi:hypothetical protein A2U01_0043969, partial [Trifolium medium]|nr:hypothetical protein [Trifolium medium]
YQIRRLGNRQSKGKNHRNRYRESSEITTDENEQETITGRNGEGEIDGEEGGI